MMTRSRKMALATVVATVCCLVQPQIVSAQFELLKQVFGGKPAAAPKAYQPFRGHQQLSQAVTEAENGDVAKSLELAREAFRDGGVNDPLQHPEAQSIAPNLLRLCTAWESKGVKPAEVVAVLSELVLPTNAPGKVRPYTGQWSLNYDTGLITRTNDRIPAPESIGAELVRWSVLSGQTKEIRKRLTLPHTAGTPQEKVKSADKPQAIAPEIEAMTARVFSVQLAVAERDAEVTNKALAELLTDANTATAPMLDYLCHAVTAAVADRNSEQAGLRLLEAVLDRAEQSLPADAGLRMNAPLLRLQAAQAHARAQRADDAKRCARAAIAKPVGNQFGAEYAAFLSHQLKQRAAAVILDAGFITDGLELAGQAPDPRAIRYIRSDGTINLAAIASRELRRLPPAERYALLRKWVLPQGDRETLQSLIDFVPVDATTKLGSGILSDVFSTDRELISTAQELGQLDELISELSLIAPQSPSVQSIQTLAMVMRDGSGTAATSGTPRTLARLQALLEATTAAIPKWEMQNKPPPPLDTYVIAVEAAVHPPWREVAEAILYRLLEHSQRAQTSRPRDHIRMAWLETLRLRSFDVLPNRDVDGRAAGPGEVDRHWVMLRPPMWDAMGFATATEQSMGALPPTWFAHEGSFTHVSSGHESDLTFGIPLTGTFEVTLECREGGWSEGRVGYGGAGCQIYAYLDQVNLAGKGNSGYESGPKMTNLLNKEPWNRCTIRIDGNTVKYFAQGQLVFEDQPGTAAPWLTLSGTPGFTPTYRNLRINGTPKIPREVALLGDERLRGWIATFFDESKPDSLRTRKYIQVKVERNGQTSNYIVEDDGTMEGEPIQLGQAVTDWKMADGELRSARRRGFFRGVSPSWLSYQRPLRDGETLRYEFWHQPGATTALPTFGETAYEFAGENHAAEAQVALPNDIVSRAEMLARRSCTGECQSGWNAVVLSLQRSVFKIELNGKEVVREQIAPTHSRRFGLFHNAATSDLRVRNIVLAGNWPKEFSAAARAAIESPEPTTKPKNSRFLTYMLNEAYISDNALEIARQAVKLDLEERYKFLHRWVIPNESHDLMRTSGAFTPTHPVPSLLEPHPIDVAMTEVRQTVDQRRVQTGGNFVCPAILLVLAATELNRLPELRDEVTAFDPSSSGEMARNRAALLGMIDLLEDSSAQAIERIRECQALLILHKDAAMYSRWGDVALASLAIQHPDTREAAFELLTSMQSNQLQAGNPGTPEFTRFVRQLHGQCTYLMYGGAPEEFATQPKTKQWRSVAQPRARSRGTGYPIASFDVIAGEMAQRGGHDFDAAYFQSPLRGNYEVTCRLSHFDWREAMVMGAGIANALQATHKIVRVTHAMKAVHELPLEMPISPRVLQWSDYKIVVKDGRYTSFIDGQKLYEEALPPEHDPWLAVAGWAGHSSRAVRDIVIRGKPIIPKDLDLLGSPDLRGWMTDYFAAEWGQTPFEWTLAEGELTSPQTLDANPTRDRRKVENIIRYHRPMLEDGVITYEFYYDPEVKLTAPPSNQYSYLGPNAPKRTLKGKTLVHAALDRMVCLLEPEGVKIHWLTDARWDRTGLTADNVESASGDVDSAAAPRPLPLKPRDWNAVTFRTQGDRLTIELNGEVVLMRDIEPTNLRHFGLFHYANESNVRVRNLRYQGDWPTQLPSIAEQDLASGPQALAAIPDSDLRAAITWDFTKSQFNRNEFHWVWDGNAEKYISPTDAGLHFSMPAAETKPQVAGIAPKIKISGNFIATMDYENLKTVAGEENWGSGIGYNVALDGSYQIGIELREWTNSAAKVTNASQTIFVSTRPHLFLNEAINEFASAGRLRLQRKGAVLYHFIAAAGSEDFRLLSQRPVGTQDIVRLAVNADASDKASGSDFIVKRLSVRATKISMGN